MADLDDDVVMRSIFIPDELDQRLTAASFRMRLSSSALILNLLEIGLKAIDDARTAPAPRDRQQGASRSAPAPHVRGDDVTDGVGSFDVQTMVKAAS